MICPPIELFAVKVEVVSLIHSQDSDHFPEDRPHAFAYHIRITNESDQRVVLKARKWILSFENGRKEVYEGDGIVGKTVDLAPQEFFEYSSYHVVDENCVVEGSYHGFSDGNPHVWVRIPKFPLHIPENFA